MSEVFGVRFSITLLRSVTFQEHSRISLNQSETNKKNSVAHFFPRLNPFRVTSHLRKRPSGKNSYAR